MRRKPRQRNSRQTRSASTADDPDPPSTCRTDGCGTCTQEVVDDRCIGCDKCEVWVHATEMCSGLPQNVIDVILEYSGEGVNYICMKCRVNRASTTSQASSPTSRSENFMADTLGQLFQHLRGMSCILTNLAAEVKALSQNRTRDTETPPSVNPSVSHDTRSHEAAHSTQEASNHSQNTTPPTTSLDQYRLIVRKELREMHERDKRKDSIIIRGLRATTPRGIVAEFADVTQRVMGTRVEVSDVVPIPGHGGICRAKILNPSEKKLVLDQAKDLRNSDYKHIYIRRDLTYAQRGELKRKRETEAASRNSVSVAPDLNSENRDTIPKTVFSNDELPQAAEGSSVPTSTPPQEPAQGTALSQAHPPAADPGSQRNDQAN